MTVESATGSFSSAIRRRMQGYSGGRSDIMRLIPIKPEKVLDVGCGAGLLGSQLRGKYPACTTYGIEPDVERAKYASERFDVVITGAVDNCTTFDKIKAEGPFDLIICADVLEHLISPKETLQSLTALLSLNGHIITSLPNVRHASTFVDLYLLGTWPQRERGIHDRTHLHFYARRDILRLGHEAGLRMQREKRNMRLFEAHPWSFAPAKLLDFWPIRAFYTFQYLHLWRRETN